MWLKRHGRWSSGHRLDPALPSHFSSATLVSGDDLRPRQRKSNYVRRVRRHDISERHLDVRRNYLGASGHPPPPPLPVLTPKPPMTPLHRKKCSSAAPTAEIIWA